MNNTLFKNQNASERAMSLLVLLTWGDVLLTYSRGIYTRLPLLNEFVDWVNPILIGVIALIGLSSLIKKVRIIDILFYVSICVIYFIEYQSHPETQHLLDEYTSDFLLDIVPCFFVGLCLVSKNYSKGFYWISILVITLMSIRTFVLGNFSEVALGESGSRGYMEHLTEAYFILPHAIYMLYSFFKERKLLTLAFVVLSTYMLLMFGSRGPFIAYIGFVICYWVLKIINSDYRRKLAFIVPIAILALPLMLFTNEIVLGIAVLLNNLIPNNKISYSILNEALLNYSQSSGRDVIHRTVFDELNNGHHPYGLGLCGDRLITQYGDYSHNFAIELWASFGYVIGSVILAIVIVVIYKAYKSCIALEEKELMVILFFTGFLPLMFSSSFLSWPFLFFFLGYCISLIRHKNNLNEQIETN